MHGRSGVIAQARVVNHPLWSEPYRPGDLKHIRFVWINRGGNSKTSGSGPMGRKAKPARLLARSLAERPLVNVAATARHAANLRAKTTPPRIIW